jgi:hypothetical protein
MVINLPDFFFANLGEKPLTGYENSVKGLYFRPTTGYLPIFLMYSVGV